MKGTVPAPVDPVKKIIVGDDGFFPAFPNDAKVGVPGMDFHFFMVDAIFYINRDPLIGKGFAVINGRLDGGIIPCAIQGYGVLCFILGVGEEWEKGKEEDNFFHFFLN